MKTFSLVLNIIIAIFIVALGVIFVIDYHKTKDSTEISSEELRQLRKTNFFLIMLLCLTVLVEHIERIFPS